MQIYTFKLSFKEGESVNSKFYGFPIARISVIYIMAQLVVSFVFMALSSVAPWWLAIIV